MQVSLFESQKIYLHVNDRCWYIMIKRENPSRGVVSYHLIKKSDNSYIFPQVFLDVSHRLTSVTFIRCTWHNDVNAGNLCNIHLEICCNQRRFQLRVTYNEHQINLNVHSNWMLQDLCSIGTSWGGGGKEAREACAPPPPPVVNRFWPYAYLLFCLCV